MDKDHGCENGIGKVLGQESEDLGSGSYATRDSYSEL